MSEHNGPAWLTVSQAAALLGLSERTIRRRCERGEIAARLVVNEGSKTWLVDQAATTSLAEGPASESPTSGDLSADTVVDVAPEVAPTVDTDMSIGADNSEQSMALSADSQIERHIGSGYAARDVARDIELLITRVMESAQAPLLEEVRALRAIQAPLLEHIEHLTTAHASLTGRIEAQAAAQTLLMDDLREARKDRAMLRAELAKLTEAQQNPPETTQAAVEEALDKAVIPYLKQVQEVSAEVDRVHEENERLRRELEAARHPWWKFW
jgi:excisionase family DNA binding protein